MRQEKADNGTIWLTFDRPERLNAFQARDYGDLRAGLERAGTDPAIRVIVLTGSGRAFSAGADRSLVDGSASDADRAEADTEFLAMLDALDGCEKPLLAAVNGLAVGIGCTMLLHCDLVLMAESARLRMPFTSLGIVPEAGSSALLPARARSGDATWAMLSSQWIDSPTAYEMGLVWRVVPDAELLEAAAQAAATIAALDPESVTATKRLLTAGRADLVRAAIEREYAEMARLHGRRAP